MSSQFLVYGLIDPTNGDLRYVGKSARGLSRPREHRASSGRRAVAHLGNWLRKLYDCDGRVPSILVLAETSSEEQAYTEEARLIRFFRDAGFSLVNTTDGGSGAPGVKLDEKTRAALLRSHLGVPQREETKRKIGEAGRGKKRSDSFCAHLRKLKTGLHHTEETKKKLSEARKGKFRLTDEHRAKLRISATGRKHTAEWKEKMRILNLGRKLSEQSIAKLRGHFVSEATREKIRQKALGRHPTPEARARMQAAQCGRKHSPETIAKMKLAQLRSWQERKLRCASKQENSK